MLNQGLRLPQMRTGRSFEPSLCRCGTAPLHAAESSYSLVAYCLRTRYLAVEMLKGHGEQSAKNATSEMVIPGLVSVVIPTYNRADRLPETLASVFGQTYRDLEVVLVDDGSTDATATVVAQCDPRLRYTRQANAGVSAARNRGLREVRGEFVCFLDSDDLWEPWKVEAQLAVLNAFPEVGMVWTDMSAIDDAGVKLHSRYLRTFYTAHRKVRIEELLNRHTTLGQVWQLAPEAEARSPVLAGNIFPQILLGNLVHTSTVMLRRSRQLLVGGFDEGLLRSGEDYDFHLRTAMHGPVALVDTAAVLYRIGCSDQLTSRRYSPDRARNALKTVQKGLAHARHRVDIDDRTLSMRFAELHAWLGEAEVEAGNVRTGRQNLRASLRRRPTARVAATLALSYLPAHAALMSCARRVKQSLSRWRTTAP
jgi:glycosyltransferase involved in cell wall biosynthesis